MVRKVQRRLAAILAADVVGYSRLVRSDEAGTLAALRTHREELIESPGTTAGSSSSWATACSPSSRPRSTP